MNIPEFTDIEAVETFLRSGGDEWCRPVVADYMALLAYDSTPDAIHIDALNGWIDTAMLSLSNGYESWNDDTA